MLKRMFAVLLALSLLALAACSAPAAPVESTPGSDAASPASPSADAPAAPSEAALPAPTEIPANQILSAQYDTADGVFTAGTAFAVTVEGAKAPILLTAHHIFGPWGGLDAQLSSEEVASFVTGGSVLDVFSEKDTGAKIGQAIPIAGAAAVGDAGSADKDLAAFYLEDADALQPLKLAENPPAAGDKLYLLAYLWDTDTPHENGIYEATCLGVEAGNIVYQLDEEFSTSGASGAPVINSAGEVVGVHAAASENGYKIANANALSLLQAAIQ